jgi:phage antirepressor YoqD-like protein
VIIIEEKILLSIKEASKLFGIGQHRLRAIIAEDYGNKYHLMIGRTIKIKRKSFETFLNEAEQI